MSTLRKNGGFFQRWVAPRPCEADAADYGTCIGLEFSLDQPPLPTPAPSPLSTRSRWTDKLPWRSKPAH